MGTQLKSPKEVVGWLGAVQAQDYYMAKWAIGLRMINATDRLIEEAINSAEIIRTHVMRPTWHFALAQDIRWMLQLTAPHLKASMKSSQAKLGLNEKIFKRTNGIIEKLLIGDKHLTRSEIVAELKKKKIAADNLQATHIMFDAELNGIVCNGPMRGKQFTYALMDERIPSTKSLPKEEALAKLSLKYFTSHGPATIQDFTWWSGLPVADAKAGLEMIKGKLMSEKIENKIYWYVEPSSVKSFQSPPLFLPAYDEFMISYTDRSASLNPSFSKIALMGNGIFRPIIVVDGKAIGIWMRTIKKDQVVIETKFFRSKENLKKKDIESLMQSFGNFLNLEVKVK
ncbi:MAG: AlkZ family DNA glycosylase [Bacteroidetes bacterium]|nr:AlkZ family DNA glycosylase [Bacteroidota bacterium]